MRRYTDKMMVSMAAIAGLTAIEVCALSHGVNGTLQTMVVGGIMGVVGFWWGKKNVVSDISKSRKR